MYTEIISIDIFVAKPWRISEEKRVSITINYTWDNMIKLQVPNTVLGFYQFYMQYQNLSYFKWEYKRFNDWNILCGNLEILLFTIKIKCEDRKRDTHLISCILSIKAPVCHWVSLSVCLFGLSLTPPKRRTPVSWNFEGWFPLVWRRF